MNRSEVYIQKVIRSALREARKRKADKGMADGERHLFIDCEYDRKHVSADVDAAIKRIFAEAATRLAAKVALLARPENVKIKADYFEDNRYRSLFDVDADHKNANDDPA